MHVWYRGPYHKENERTKLNNIQSSEKTHIKFGADILISDEVEIKEKKIGPEFFFFLRNSR